MDMKKVNAGKLRAMGYDARERVLRVELEDGSALEYLNVGADVWKRFSTSGVAWSFYRDNIEEEFGCRRGSATRKADRSALDDLFGKAEDTD
jgi:hypothetical protein